MGRPPKNLVMYIAKCVAGGTIVYGLSALFHYTDIAWCLISIVLVLSPDSREAIPLAFTRIKANLTGGISSVLCLLIGTPGVVTVSLAFILTISFCFLFKVMTGVRSALAAAIIVILHSSGEHLWDTALERILAVVVGCVLGLLVTYLFHQTNIKEWIMPAQDGE